jgi:putative FmdB family regulatory protein
VPIYGYRCSNCGHQFETMQNVSAKRLEVCPKCEGKLTKVMYAAGVIFKGSGFYSTDYKASAKESDSSSNGSGSASESGGGGSDSAKTESKPKPESKSESAD